MNTWNIFKRELASYFNQATAYAIIVVFLLLSLGFAFTIGAFMRVGDASLEYSFFFWLQWIFMVLAPAVGMKLWSDEQRNGTIELLGTFPVSLWSAILGKYLAACVVWLVALLLTFPIVITVGYLGKPDYTMILSGYLGSYLIACTFLAITVLVSACTRDQVVCLIVSVILCVLMVLCGYDEIVSVARKAAEGSVAYLAEALNSIGVSQNFVDWLRRGADGTGRSVGEALSAIGVFDHARSLGRGLFRLQDAVWFGSIIAASLLGTSAILSAKRS